MVQGRVWKECRDMGTDQKIKNNAGHSFLFEAVDKIIQLVCRHRPYRPISFPGGKTFAFTIIDDTDESTIENTKPIYDYLHGLGLLTTKTAWVLSSNEPEAQPSQGGSLDDPDYRAFVLELRDKGFEIASHGARGGSSQRDEILKAMERFKNVIGYYPRIHINHFVNKDNLYWGVHRLDFLWLKLIYRLAQGREEFSGHIPASGHFWGDFAQRHVNYMVNFSFHEINLARINPQIPYRDPRRPYSNYWLHTSDGGVVPTFNRLLRSENLDQLERDGGLCIAYTHFGKGFCENGEVNETTRERLADLASRNGWFAPASEILDYLRTKEENTKPLRFGQRAYVEFRWTLEKLFYGST